MKTILFAMPGNEVLTTQLAQKLDAEMGQLVIRHFPDGETYVRLESEVKHKRVVLVCTLHEPDDKFLPLYFLSKTAMSLGALSTLLIAPYLAYMRQDKSFHSGEGVTSSYFGSLISQFVKGIVTIDPHLHRLSTLSEVYSIPNKVMHAADLISAWIKANIKNPVIVGPDSESEQWVVEVAKKADAPFMTLQKIRRGDREVEISVPKVEAFEEHTPVLVDDIISTAHTMIETVDHLINAGMKPPVCVGIHGVFSDGAYEALQAKGVANIITCNTISHKSNQIDITDLLVEGFLQLGS